MSYNVISLGREAQLINALRDRVGFDPCRLRAIVDLAALGLVVVAAGVCGKLAAPAVPVSGTPVQVILPVGIGRHHAAIGGAAYGWWPPRTSRRLAGEL